MKILQNIEPKIVFSYFEEISQIPRGSGNEKAISDYLVQFAKDLNLEVIQDDVLNVIIKKPGTKGYENSKTVIIQGHMDMVCEKNKGTNHDFKKDPLKLRVVDDYVYATDTTLGADNGIAVAYGLALLASNDIEHPPLEILITTDEETGMSGAMGVSKEHISGELLINLDNEEEGQLLVSCAGGARGKSSINIEWENNDNKIMVQVTIRGLKGGHSGIEIHKERGNSNKIMGRILKDMSSKVDFNIQSINGGSKNNAIPREADSVIAIDQSDLEKVKEILSIWEETLLNELRAQDPGIKVSLEVVEDGAKKVFTKDCTSKVVELLYLYPNGVNTRSIEIEGLVESSMNLGVVATLENVVEFDSAIRSSVASLKKDLILKTKIITELIGGKFEETASYPEWQYDRESALRDICQKVHVDVYGKEAEIAAIHAGVECGLFNEKLGKLDMISFGPNLYDVHTPQEHMSISSVESIWKYLKAVLKELK